MAQKLWHWTGEEFGGRRAFFPAVHVRLDVEADRIQAVFFKSVDEQEVSGPLSTEAELNALLENYSDLPVATLEPSRIYLDGSIFKQEMAGQHIQAISMAILSRENEMLGSAEMDGPALYAFPVNPDLSVRAPFNVLSKTFRMKRKAAHARLLDSELWPVMVSVDDDDTPFTAANIIVRNSSTFGFKTNITGWVVSADRPENDGIIGTIPTLRVLTPEITVAPDATASVDIQVETRDGQLITTANSSIYLEKTGGYLPFKRVNAKNGVAKFRVRALGVQSGESFKVKVGFRNFSGCSEVLVKVV